MVMLDAQPRLIVPCCGRGIVAAKAGGGSAVAAVGPGARSVFSVPAVQCRRGQRNSGNRQRRQPVADFVLFRTSARANDVITNIRAMFKKEDTPRVELDVNQLIEQVLAPTKQTISSKNV
ncbi:MAG TPA: hypothetical protein VI137_00350, partial [Pseudolabrys sp.]